MSNNRKIDIRLWCTYLLVLNMVSAYWDVGTTTVGPVRTDTVPRQSFFRWQITQFEWLRYWTPYWDWNDIDARRRLNVIAGISIDFLCLGTAVILNRRTLITSANYLDPYMTRQKDLRIWALGREGLFNTPYRYRVWRVRRVLPRSNNPEHWHGPRGRHVPRHDIAIIHSWDQIYIYHTSPNRYHYPYRAQICDKHMKLGQKLWFAGSGFEHMQHIMENYKIFYALQERSEVVDCSIYLPKWWGKFICIRNTHSFPGVPNGGGLFSDLKLVGIGCFEIRYNEDRIMVFTDLRYYVDWIYILANITPGEYYEYAYPQWSIQVNWAYDGNGNYPYIPTFQIQDDLFPLGKK